MYVAARGPRVSPGRITPALAVPRWLVVALVLAVVVIALARRAPAPGTPSAGMTAQGAACVLPPFLAGRDGVVQTPVASAPPIPLEGARAEVLAGFSVAARVLGTERYRFDREATWSPLDLALGWGRMREDAVLSQLSISQGGRFFHWRSAQAPPIPVDELTASASNMHMVPANEAVADALHAIDAGDAVRIDGWLIRIEAPDGWRWSSSLSRHDSGAGACELVYVCAVTPQ